MDLHTSAELMYDNPISTVRVLDPRSGGDIEDVFTRMLLPQAIPAKARAILSTVEEVEIAPDTLGLIQVRSTWARLGFSSPPTVADPGFRGTLVLELFNTASYAIFVRPNDAIWSLLKVPLVPGTEPLYEGRYQGQQGLQIPKPL